MKMNIKSAVEKDLVIVNNIISYRDYLRNYGFVHEFEEDAEQINNFLSATKNILERLRDNPFQTIKETDPYGGEVIVVNENLNALDNLTKSDPLQNPDNTFCFYADVYDRVPNFEDDKNHWSNIWGEKIAKNTIEALKSQGYKVTWMTGGCLGAF